VAAVVSAVAMLSLALALLVPAGPAAASEKENSCKDCHRNPDFLVTNKLLYDYYQEWSRSVHAANGMSCDDCHGGNSEATEKDEAHGEGVRASDPTSGVYYKNIPDTCGSCHEAILEGFVTSNHFEHVEKRKNDEQGPTCVTCHGAIDSEVLNVNTVADACARCHNPETDNHPDHHQHDRSEQDCFRCHFIAPTPSRHPRQRDDHPAG